MPNDSAAMNEDRRESEGRARCFYHPNRETQVACGRCGHPLCPDCVRHGATGVRCADCLRLPRRAMGFASRAQILRAVGAAGAIAAAGGLALGFLGWVGWLPALAVGFAVGSGAFVASGRHRDATVQGVAGAMAFASILLAATIISVIQAKTGQGAMEAIISFPYERFLPPALAAMAGAIVRFFV